MRCRRKRGNRVVKGDCNSVRRCLILAALLVCCAVPLHAQKWTLSHISSATQLVDNGTVYDAFPTMMKASNGTILNFYRKGTTHATDRGVIMLKTSTDNGVTWNLFAGTNYCSGGDPAGCLFADTSVNQFDSRNGSGGLSYDGSTAIFFWQQYNQTGGTVAGVPSSASAGAFYSRSTDNGATWSSPTALTGYFWTYGQLVVIPNGGGANGPAGGSGNCSAGCVAVSLGNNQTVSGGHQRLVFSYNNGSTWDTTHDEAITGSVTDEHAFLWTGGNQIISFDRNNANLNPVFLYTNDLGATWTATTTNITFVPTPPGWSVDLNGQIIVSPWLFDSKLSDGSVTLFFAERDNWDDPTPQHVYNYERALTFLPSDAVASPTGFLVPQTLYAQPRVTTFPNAGYPTVVEIATDPVKLLVEWYQQVSIGSTTPVNLYTLTGTFALGDTVLRGITVKGMVVQ
jgi:hypothetical protein